MSAAFRKNKTFCVYCPSKAGIFSFSTWTEDRTPEQHPSISVTSFTGLSTVLLLGESPSLAGQNAVSHELVSWTDPCEADLEGE